MATSYRALPFVPPVFFNVTAISAQNGSSFIECWQILPNFTTSSQAGTTGASILQLGNLANMSYSVIPPGFNAGLHNAPNTQWVAFLSGVAHITLPNSTVEAFVPGGKNGLIFAADSVDSGAKGHLTNYPSESETTVLQIPTGGVVPQHNVLYPGPCQPAQLQRRNGGGLDDLD